MKKLDYPSRDVRAVRSLLGELFEGDPLIDPDEPTVRKWLKEFKGHFSAVPGVVVMMWSGHGLPPTSADAMRLLTVDSASDGDDGLSPQDVIRACARTGANQLLMVVDACYSGAALSAGAVAANAMGGVAQPDDRPPWVGVLASCSDAETARDGVFAAELTRLLREGPRDADLQRRWSVHSPLLRGDDLCDAVVKEWPAQEAQRPMYQATGSAWFMVPNPLWQPDAPAQVVEHLP